MRAVLLLALLLLTAPAQGATYFVATTGDDANAGDAAAPWRTLQHAVDSVLPGDTILVRAGTYVGCHISRSGTPGAPCTLAPEPGAAVVIDSASPFAWWNGTVEVENCSDWVIKGLECRGIPHYSIYLHDCSNIAVRNCHLHGNPVSGLQVSDSRDCLVESNRCYDSGYTGMSVVGNSAGIVVRHNRFYSNVASGLYGCGCNGVLLGCTFEANTLWSNGGGISVETAADLTIRNNLIYANSGDGVWLNGASARIYNNTIVQPAESGWAVSLSGGGSDLVNNVLYCYEQVPGTVAIGSRYDLGVCDYNTVMNSFSVGDLPAWKALGFDAHSPIVVSLPDVLFADLAGGDYRLKVGSLALEAGLDLSGWGVTEDLEGNRRPLGLFHDIGCYEFDEYGRFWDVLVNYWAYTQIEACAAAGVVSGYQDGSFKPRTLVKRDQMAVFLTRALAGGSVPDYTGPASFWDVPSSYWAYDAIEYVAHAQVAMGYKDGSYGPGLGVNRGQMAAFLARAMEPLSERPDLPSYTPPATPSFPDVAPSFAFYKPIEYLKEHAVTGGYADGRYHPERVCTRDQMAVFVVKAFGLL